MITAFSSRILPSFQTQWLAYISHPLLLFIISIALRKTYEKPCVVKKDMESMNIFIAFRAPAKSHSKHMVTALASILQLDSLNTHYITLALFHAQVLYSAIVHTISFKCSSCTFKPFKGTDISHMVSIFFLWISHLGLFVLSAYRSAHNIELHLQRYGTDISNPPY